jgi:hypothetical protein
MNRASIGEWIKGHLYVANKIRLMLLVFTEFWYECGGR